MDTLAQIYKRHSGGTKFNDKGVIHSYIEVYSEIFKPYRETAKRVLEIGLYDGHSMRMWEDYFSNSDVHGIDCDEQPHGGKADLRPMIAERMHFIHIMNACANDQVEFHFSKIKFDVIIDDASHNIDDQIKIYHNFKHHLTDDGIYVIEDVQDLDRDRALLEKIPGARILDRRGLKKRYDDVLIVIGGK